MANKLQAIRGMNDILPERTAQWQFLEDRSREVLSAYGFREIRLPIVEKTELFRRSIGEVTDIVEKEMYSFEDRNGDNLSLRPEGTAGCVRACVQHGLTHNQVQRLWYAGPMFRHERPQKGRYRQFHQIGVEVFGLEGPDIDAELLLMTARLWKQLGLQQIKLQVNTLGTGQARAQFRDELVAFLGTRVEQLDDDSRRRLSTNPLRILDSKNPQVQAVLDEAPRLSEFIDEESERHFSGLCERLDSAGVAYEINHRLVRGLDYYGRTVFEWVTDQLGAQGTVCAGGRYDGLVEYLGGQPVPAVGFAMGLERLVSMIEEQQIAVPGRHPHLYVIAAGEEAARKAMLVGESLRDSLPQLRVTTHCGGGSFKSQFRKADRSGATWALILGDDELERGEAALKPLRTREQQETVSLEKLGNHLARLLDLNGAA